MFSHILTIHKIASQPHWGQVVSNLTPFVCFRNEPHACRGVTVESGWYSCKPLTKLCFKHSTYTTSIRYSICILQPLEELQRALWSTSYGGPGGSLSRTSRVVRASIHPTTPWIMCVVESIVSVCVCVSQTLQLLIWLYQNLLIICHGVTVTKNWKTSANIGDRLKWQWEEKLCEMIIVSFKVVFKNSPPVKFPSCSRTFAWYLHCYDGDSNQFSRMRRIM